MKGFRMFCGSPRPRGAALVTCVLILTLLLLLSLGLLGIAQKEGSIADNDVNMVRGLYAAEAGLESGYQQLRGLVVNNGGVVTDAQLATITAPTLSDTSLSSRFTIALQTQKGNPAGAPPYYTTLDSGAFRQLRAKVQDYLLTSTATHTNSAKATKVALSQVVQYGQIPLFQFGLFYGRGVDLELFPGPTMTFSGRVHSNANIWLRAKNAGSDLTFNSYMTAVGGIYRGMKSAPTDVGAGNVNIKNAGGTYQNLNFDHDSNVGFTGSWTAEQWKTQALSTYGGKVLDGAMGVPEIVPPVPGLFYNPANPDVVAHQMIEQGTGSDDAAMKNAKMYYQAGLLILNGQAKQWSGTSLVNVDMSSCAAGTIGTASFRDARQDKTMTARQIDIAKLTACGKVPANGLLYVSEQQTGNDDRGVRLVNGSTLPSGGLSVVSDNPVYIQGNYNNINKQPAAVMADAVTVLSNNWTDANSFNTYLFQRVATETTVNAALATGPSVESTGTDVAGLSNGGAHNVIRFLEDWSTQGSGDWNRPDTPFHFSGSIVALWHSQHAQAPFRSSNPDTSVWYMTSGLTAQYYAPPERDWGYDTTFDTTQPPGAPYAVVMLRRAWVKM